MARCYHLSWTAWQTVSLVRPLLTPRGISLVRACVNYSAPHNHDVHVVLSVCLQRHLTFSLVRTPHADLKSMKISTDAEIGDIKKARLLLKSVIQSNPAHAPGWCVATAFLHLLRLPVQCDCRRLSYNSTRLLLGITSAGSQQLDSRNLLEKWQQLDSSYRRAVKNAPKTR